MHLLGDLAAVEPGIGLLDGADLVLHERTVDEPCPHVQHVDGLPVEILEAPAPVGLHRQLLVIVAERPVEVDHALDEGRREDPDAAVVQQVDRAIVPHGVIAQMRIAMDHAVEIERHVPGPEHVHRDPVAFLLIGMGLDEFHHRGAVQPGHGDQPAGREVVDHVGDVDLALARQHVPVERHVGGLAGVVELFLEPRGQLLVDQAGVDRVVVALVDREDPVELPQIRLDRRGHVGILQLDRHLGVVGKRSPMDLAEGGGGGRFPVEGREPLAPVGAQLAHHPALDERPAHRRGVRLQVAEFVDVLLRQRVRHGG
mmetsp:Transcript_32142/g.44869  ORF Transcript_32142/g.44869 Transcript_32142/m.44869 type:complete len:313 (-) Transcript_32142:195-1133(-)